MDKIEKEKKVVKKMIGIYCKSKHGREELCPTCTELNEYAIKRLDNCPYGENKPFCSSCKTHCYSSSKQEQIKKVMRYSGPRMIFKDPILAIRYLINFSIFLF